jgi:uncharacterized membrane protein
MLRIEEILDNGIVMLIICAIISVIVIKILWVKTKGFKKDKWKCWIPISIYSIIVCIGFIFAKGLDFYFGIFMYGICSLIITIIIEIIISLIQLAHKNDVINKKK